MMNPRLALITLAFFTVEFRIDASPKSPPGGAFWPIEPDGNRERTHFQQIFDHQGRLYAAALRWGNYPETKLHYDLLVSSDQGSTWRTLFTSPDHWDTLKLTAPRAVAAGTSRSLWFGGRYQGLFRSVDGGKTWEEAGPGSKFTALVQLQDGRIAIGYDNGDVWRRDHEDEGWERIGTVHGGVSDLISGTTNQLLARSKYAKVFRFDGSGSWSSVAIPDEASVRIVTATRLGTLYLARYGGGVFRSIDNGESWTLFNQDLEEKNGPSMIFRGIFIDPTREDSIWLGVSYSDSCCHSVFHSQDDGQTWIEKEGQSWPLFADRNFILFRQPDGLEREARNGKREAVGWRNIEIACRAGETISQPGFLFSGQGTFCARASNARVEVAGNLDPTIIRELALGSDGKVFAATDRGLFSSDRAQLWRRVTALDTSDVRAIVAAQNLVVAGTVNGELWSMADGLDWKMVASLPSSGPIRSIVLTRAGAVVVARGSDLVFSADLDSWRRLGSVPGESLTSILSFDDRLLVRTEKGSFAYRDRPSGWEEWESVELEGWNRIAVEGLELEFPTYGRPTRVEMSSHNFSVVNYNPAFRQTIGDGFLERKADDIQFWFSRQPSEHPRSMAQVASQCLSSVVPIEGRDQAFECIPRLDGDSTWNTMWVFEDGQDIFELLLTSSLDTNVLHRMRDSVTPASESKMTR